MAAYQTVQSFPAASAPWLIALRCIDAEQPDLELCCVPHAHDKAIAIEDPHDLP
jgi:hypothetical protein